MKAARSQWSLVAIRSFLGIVYFSNGLAKLFDFSAFSLGPWSQYLINRGGAYNIIAANVHNGGIGPLRDFATGFVLPHWNVLAWVLTGGELAVGLGLMLGILGRIAALGGLAMSLLLFLWSVGAGAWTYDFMYEPILLAILALTPGLPGLDTLLLSLFRRGRPAIPPRREPLTKPAAHSRAH
ncbi:MAG: DoxX family membrane protein [Candidatus Dormibacteraeota bacterium]|nr:DoxX family membrane protein [Candidatus Dormibacteraeota bacterium]